MSADQGHGSDSKLAVWFPELDSSVIDKLQRFQTEVLRANKHLSLIPSTAEKSIESAFTADTVLAVKHLAPLLVSGQPVYDLGGGAGFSGVILSLLSPTTKVTLVDRDQKKLDFVLQVGKGLGITNLEIMRANLDELPDSSVTNGILKSSLTLPKSLLALRKAFGKGSKLFHLKGDSWSTELAQLPSQLFSQWSPSLIANYKVPGLEIQNSLILTEKIASA